MSERHTPGPWLANQALAVVDVPGRDAPICALLWPTDLRNEEETRANARLIAAAPDHALIGWALCAPNLGRWVPWDATHGEFVFDGFRYATELDEFGLPKMTDGLRANLQRVRAAILAAEGMAA